MQIRLAKGVIRKILSRKELREGFWGWRGGRAGIEAGGAGHKNLQDRAISSSPLAVREEPVITGCRWIGSEVQQRPRGRRAPTVSLWHGLQRLSTYEGTCTLVTRGGPPPLGLDIEAQRFNAGKEVLEISESRSMPQGAKGRHLVSQTRGGWTNSSGRDGQAVGRMRTVPVKTAQNQSPSTSIMGSGTISKETHSENHQTIST